MSTALRKLLIISSFLIVEEGDFPKIFKPVFFSKTKRWELIVLTLKLEYKYSTLDNQKGMFVMDETSETIEVKESVELYSQVFTTVTNTGTKKKLSSSLKEVLEVAAGIKNPLEPDDPYLLRLLDICKHGMMQTLDKFNHSIATCR